MEDKVYARLIDSVRTFASSGETNYRVSLPNKHFEPTTYPYIEVADFRLDPRTQGSGGGDHRMVRGLLQLTVVEEKNVGINRANNLAEDIISAYPLGLNLFETPICVTVNEQGSKRPLLDQDKDVRIPVIIPYISFLSTAA